MINVASLELIAFTFRQTARKANDNENSTNQSRDWKRVNLTWHCSTMSGLIGPLARPTERWWPLPVYLRGNWFLLSGFILKRSRKWNLLWRGFRSLVYSLFPCLIDWNLWEVICVRSASITITRLLTLISQVEAQPHVMISPWEKQQTETLSVSLPDGLKSKVYFSIKSQISHDLVCFSLPFGV